MKPLLVLGSLNADLVVPMHHFPLPGETVCGETLLVFPGGKGANQAAAAAMLGQKTYFAGNIGNSHEALLCSALQNAGVHLDQLRKVEGPTGQAIIMLQKGGQNSIIVIGGANLSWDDALPFGYPEAIREAGALLLQREIPERINIAAAKIAASVGVPVVLDVGGSSEPIATELLRYVTVLSPNETELHGITGLPTDTQAEAIAAAQSLHASGVQTVLVKLGERGAMIVPATDEPFSLPAFSVNVVDTTGAGDCFTAAYTTAMMRGISEHERLGFAIAAAALCVQRMGAMPSMPTLADVEAFLDSP